MAHDVVTGGVPGEMMKPLIFAFMALTFSSSVIAEWVKFGETEKFTIYLENNTGQKKRGLIKVWELWDYKATLPGGVHSMRIQREYDCKNNRQRLLTASAFTVQIAEGDTVASKDSPAEWEPVSPDSGAEDVLRFLCTL